MSWLNVTVSAARVTGAMPKVRRRKERSRVGMMRLQLIAAATFAFGAQLFLGFGDAVLHAGSQRRLRRLQSLVNVDRDIPLFQLLRHAGGVETRVLTPHGIGFLAVPEIMTEEDVEEMVEGRLEQRDGLGGRFAGRLHLERMGPPVLRGAARRDIG